MSTVAHPFGCRIVAKLPKLHSQVIGKSFGNRYAEGIFLCSDDKTPAIHMFDMISRKIMLVSDFKTYHDQFPFRSQHCLLYPSYTAAEIAKMHTQDVADDAAVSAEQQTQAFTRSQTRALEATQAATEDLVSTAVIAFPVLSDPTAFTPLPAPIMPDEIVGTLPAALIMRPQDIPSKPARMNTPGGLPRLDAKLADLTEHDIAKTMARHNFTFVLPLHYSPPTLPAPLGEMIVTVKSAVKLGKEKSAVWVQFLAPPTHEGFKMQLYPRSHAPSRGVGQGQDFSILSALAVTSPRATTFLDLGITDLTSAKVTSAMLLAFSSLPRLPVFTASALDDLETTTSDHGASRSPNAPTDPTPMPPQPASSAAKLFLDSIIPPASHTMPRVRRVTEADLHSVFDDEDDTSAPDGYTRYTPDPSHRGEAMRQRLRSHWLAAEDLEMAGLIKRKVWERVLRSTLLPSDTIFQTRFHYKIKRKGGKFDICKVRLVV